MAGNAFKTNMVWWQLYTLSTTKNVAIKNKELCSFNMSFNILQATQSWVQHVKAEGNSHTRRILK